MADLRTIFTDDDGDGIYDDIHVVNVMDETSHQNRSHHHEHSHSSSSYVSGGSSLNLSGKSKLKIAGIIFATIIVASFICKIFLVIATLFGLAMGWI